MVSCGRGGRAKRILADNPLFMGVSLKPLTVLLLCYKGKIVHPLLLHRVVNTHVLKLTLIQLEVFPAALGTVLNEASVTVYRDECSSGYGLKLLP